jgi:chemotaxis protein methyltransferase CheR
MTAKISDAVLSNLSDFVACHLGLHFPRERWLDLQRAVGGAAQECGCRHDLDRYIQGLLSPALPQNHLELLASHLTVAETYFFREKRSLEILEERIVPELIRARAGLGTPIRIWSAGCATGEEPYSVAIVLNKLLAGLKGRNIEILATDLNTKSLQKASAGTYGDWSFRDTPRWVRHTYFEAGEDDRCTIVPAIKKMVRFAPLNLMDDAYPPLSNWPNGFDVIFCRNVLMYFTPEGMRKVIRQLYRSLATDGWLIVSPTETSHELFSEFATVSFGDATFYRKSATGLPTKFLVPVFDESRSVVQLPEWIMPAPEPTRISCDEIRRESPDNEACPESAAPPAISHRQALALYEQGRYGEMEQMIVALPSGDMDRASAMLLLARAYANQGKLAVALGWCDKAIAADKMAAPAHYLRSTILQEQGSSREAVLALKQAVYVDPQFVLGHLSLGNLAQKHGRRQESEKHFENVLLLLARYEPEDIVPESEGLSGGRLREMILPANQGTAATQTGRPRIRVRQQVRNIESSRK